MKTKQGIIAGIIASVIFGATAIFSKITFELGVDSMLLIVLRNLLALPVFYIAAKISGISLKIDRRSLWHLIVLTLLFFGPNNVVAFMAYDHIPVGQVTVIHYLYPGLIVIIERLFFRQQISKIKWLAVSFCLAGVLCFTPEGGFSLAGGTLFGYLLALSSAVFYGSYVVGMAHSIAQNLHVLQLTFYLNIFSSIQPFLFSWYRGGLSLDFPAQAWIYIALIAISVSVIGFICLQICIKNCGSVTAAIVFTLEPITALFMGIIMLKEPYTIASLIGCVLILVSVILIAKGGAKAPLSIKNNT